MPTIAELIAYAMANNCSDIHITATLPPIFRHMGELFPGKYQTTPQQNEQLILSMLSEKQIMLLNEGSDLDFSMQTEKGVRQRVNVYRQRGHLCAAIRILNQKVPTLDELQLPSVIKKLACEHRGLILVTGQTGSGKSTTLAAIIDYINTNRRCHIITIEDPVEYLHTNKKSMIHQREVGSDVASFAVAMRSILREDPDVILLGEMRDYETIAAAVTAAETGHLVLSTLHTPGAAQTIDRIIDVFPPHNQGQIRTQLSGVLKGIITQHLVPLMTGEGRIAATEILLGTDAVLNLIRENKAHQLNSVMQAGSAIGMHTLDACLARLVRERRISVEEALKKAVNHSEFKQYLQMRI
ncbi:MAG: type IV pilus twitching motility protein PilT [Bacillota bacterium]|jgi:twitching motility protein PilT